MRIFGRFSNVKPPPAHNWPAAWQRILDAAANHGSDCDELIVQGPADEKEVRRVETELGRRLPEGFREVILGFSRRASLRWQLPDETRLPEDLDEIFSGELGWDLGTVVELERGRLEWIKECFPNQDDDYDAVWHNKFSFFSVGNGDQLAIDEDDPSGSVVYLSHDDGDGHGLKLGENFSDYISRSSALACVGAEDWQWLPFHPGEGELLESDSALGNAWRKWFGI